MKKETKKIKHKHRKNKNKSNKKKKNKSKNHKLNTFLFIINVYLLPRSEIEPNRAFIFPLSPYRRVNFEKSRTKRRNSRNVGLS